jgi:very-short-patch-repair endonuclease
MAEANPTSEAQTLLTRARELRGTLTPAKILLWQSLRNKQLCGLRFRRQQPIDRFIVDFFCASARLVIELDGISHEGKSTYDAARDEYLKSQGMHVMRFKNEDIYNNLCGVLEMIVQYCEDAMRSE